MQISKIVIPKRIFKEIKYNGEDAAKKGGMARAILFGGRDDEGSIEIFDIYNLPIRDKPPTNKIKKFFYKLSDDALIASAFPSYSRCSDYNRQTAIKKEKQYVEVTAYTYPCDITRLKITKETKREPINPDRIAELIYSIPSDKALALGLNGEYLDLGIPE